MKLRIQLDQDFEVDLNDFSFEGLTEDQIKRKNLLNGISMRLDLVRLRLKEKIPNLLITVKNYQYHKEVEFHEVELERELTRGEKINIYKWVIERANRKIRIMKQELTEEQIASIQYGAGFEKRI